MSHYYSRYPSQIELSRQIALQRELQMARALQRQRELQESDYKRLKQLQKIKADRDFLEYKEIRESRRMLAEEEIRKERLIRDQLQRQHILHLEAANKARQERERHLKIQKEIIQEEKIQKATFVAQSQKIQLDLKLRDKQQADRNNILVLEQQAEQEKLQRQINRISIEIGKIFDGRQERKKNQLVQLEELDKKSFELKQAMRSSLVKQKALEDSLSELSKLIGI